MLICTPTRQCDAHRDGAPTGEKCPGYCDAGDCRELAEHETGPNGETYCAWHAAANLRAS